ncbi:hypothetical protein QUB30_03450 [Microcoleus sp. BROC3]
MGFFKAMCPGGSCSRVEVRRLMISQHHARIAIDRVETASTNRIP